jgi:hypothetical protein
MGFYLPQGQDLLNLPLKNRSTPFTGCRSVARIIYVRAPFFYCIPALSANFTLMTITLLRQKMTVNRTPPGRRHGRGSRSGGYGGDWDLAQAEGPIHVCWRLCTILSRRFILRRLQGWQPGYRPGSQRPQGGNDCLLSRGRYQEKSEITCGRRSKDNSGDQGHSRRRVDRLVKDADGNLIGLIS